MIEAAGTLTIALMSIGFLFIGVSFGRGAICWEGITGKVFLSAMSFFAFAFFLLSLVAVWQCVELYFLN